MVDVETVRRIALSLPESRDGSTATALRFYVGDKQFAWTSSWSVFRAERIPRIPPNRLIRESRIWLQTSKRAEGALEMSRDLKKLEEEVSAWPRVSAHP